MFLFLFSLIGAVVLLVLTVVFAYINRKRNWDIPILIIINIFTLLLFIFSTIATATNGTEYFSYLDRKMRLHEQSTGQ